MVLHVLAYLAVAQHDVAAAVLCNLGIVGHEDDGASLAVELLEEHQDFEAGAGIQVTGCLVRQNNGRVVDESARNGYALHLSARHLVALVLQAVGKSHGGECLDGCLAAHLGGVLAVVEQGQLHILHSRGLGEQVVVLEDEAYLAVAQSGALAALHLAHGHSVEDVFSRGGGVEAAQLVEQGALAASRGAHDGHELALVDLEGHAAQCLHHLVAHLELAAHVLQLDDYLSVFFFFTHKPSLLFGT